MRKGRNLDPGHDATQPWDLDPGHDLRRPVSTTGTRNHSMIEPPPAMKIDAAELVARFGLLSGVHGPCAHPSGFLFLRQASPDGVTILDVFVCPHCNARRMVDRDGNVVAATEGKGWEGG